MSTPDTAKLARRLHGYLTATPVHGAVAARDMGLPAVQVQKALEQLERAGLAARSAAPDGTRWALGPSGAQPVLSPGHAPGTPACCPLPDCGAWLHMVVITDTPICLSFSQGDQFLADGDQSWEVRCENGHVVLLPPGNGAENHVFGECSCDMEDPAGFCGHGDFDRLRQIACEPASADKTP
jgi:hypothetical protein